MVRYILSSMNVLNGLLALAVAAVVNFAVIPVLDPVARIPLPAVQGAVTSPSGEQKTEQKTELKMSSQRFPVADYAVISEQNLFHPERKVPLEKQPEKIIPKPELFLYGTLITGDASYAFIEDKKAPYSTAGRGKRQTTLKKGDHLSGYTVSEIEADRIVLVKGEEKIVVMLDDREKRRASEAPAVPAAARTAAGIPAPPPAAPSSPQAPASAAASPGPGIASPAPRPAAQAMPSSVPDVPATRPGGIGGQGTWPPTKGSIDQTRQKLEEGQQMRMNQILRKK